LRRERHGEIGFTRTGRSDSEHEIGLFECTNVRRLRLSPRLHDAPSRRDLTLRRVGRTVLMPHVPDETVKFRGSHVLALLHDFIKLLENGLAYGAGRFRTAQNDNIAMCVGLDTEAIFEQRQIGVELPEKCGEMAVVLERHNHPST
jgi:hypothetical protein